MQKKIAIALPPYLKKFYLYEYDGFQTVKNDGLHDEIKVSKASELGKLLQLIIKPIPYVQKYDRPSGTGALTIHYTTREKIAEVAVDKLPTLIRVMDETFRRSLINEVRGIHEITEGEYSVFIEKFLDRRGIVRDVDIEFETARKIYRDYMEQTARKSAKIYA